MHTDPLRRELRFARMLGPLNDADLDHLAAALELPPELDGGPGAVAEAIREVLADRRADRRHHAPAELTDPADRRLRERLYFLMTGPRLFPAIRPLVEAINAAFGCALDGAAWSRRGRRDLAARAWSFLLDQPPARRAELAERFVAAALAAARARRRDGGGADAGSKDAETLGRPDAGSKDAETPRLGATPQGCASADAEDVGRPAADPAGPPTPAAPAIAASEGRASDDAKAPAPRLAVGPTIFGRDGSPMRSRLPV